MLEGTLFIAIAIYLISLTIIVNISINRYCRSPRSASDISVLFYYTKVWILSEYYSNVRSSHQRCSMTKGVLGNFTKFTGKHLHQSLFFNKVAGLRPEACNFIKKETLAQWREFWRNIFVFHYVKPLVSTLGKYYLCHIRQGKFCN